MNTATTNQSDSFVSEPNKGQSIAFIGTGNMGLPLIRKLVENNYTLRLYDKYDRNIEYLKGENITWCENPKEAASNADVVLTCLPLPEHVLDNMTGKNGALEGMQKGTTWIDTSTTDYHNTLNIAEKAENKGVHSLEAPVSNLSHMGADFANVSFYVAGSSVGYKNTKLLFDIMGKKSFYVGDIGMGQTVKLFTNLLFYTATVVWGELLIVARNHDIPLQWFWKFARNSCGNSFVTDQITPFILDGSYDHSCTLEIAIKDTELANNLSEEAGIAMPIGHAVKQRYSVAGEEYDDQENHVIVVKLSEIENECMLQIPHFDAPSKYGNSSKYIHSAEMDQDEYGRIKPSVSDTYFGDISSPDQDIVGKAKTIMEFMAFVNYKILKETSLLASSMNLESDFIQEVVRWSCGPSWVADNKDKYAPNSKYITEFTNLINGQELKFLNQLIPLLVKN